MLEIMRQESNNCNENASNSQNHQRFPVLDVNQLQYSDKYFDDKYEYRHIILPKEFSRHVPRTHLMTETEWRNLGIQQSPGWVHYLLHAPEPHVLMFRRLIQTIEQHETLPCEESEEEVDELDTSDVAEMELDEEDDDDDDRGCC